MAYPTPHDCLHNAIARWEGEWQADPNDSANYAHCRDGSVRLIGTMRGVTPDIYARHKGVDPCSLTPDQMQREITLDIAADIGISLFFAGPGFSRQTWSPLVEIAVDIGWGSGPGRAVKMLQQQIGAQVDGIIGPQTGAVLDHYLEAHEIAPACEALTAARVQFYLDISEERQIPRRLAQTGKLVPDHQPGLVAAMERLDPAHPGRIIQTARACVVTSIEPCRRRPK